jgi:death on curing protein
VCSASLELTNFGNPRQRILSHETSQIFPRRVARKADAALVTRTPPPTESHLRTMSIESQEIDPQDLRRTCRVVPPSGEMTGQQDPEFLTREIVDAIHEDQIHAFGGLHGVRDENALESAIAAAQNVYHYGGGDLCEIAAAYAYHLAESQACFDGNKRTGVQASPVFLEGCGIDTSRLPEQQTYDLMIKIADHQAARSDFGVYLRSESMSC